MSQLILLTLSSLLFGHGNSFYLPGVAPHEYEFGESVKIKVNKLDSVLTQLPYNYYDLPFCKPTNGVKQDAENLGEVMLLLLLLLLFLIYVKLTYDDVFFLLKCHFRF